MTDPIDELKIRAEVLHHDLTTAKPSALARLRALTEYRRASEEALLATAPTLRRKHCLAIVAKECGFRGWDDAVAVLEGEGVSEDFGDLLYPKGWGAHLNHWFAAYEEAKSFHLGQGGYLLAYRRHFFVADRHYIAAIGLDPEDPDWALLGWDWARPLVLHARRRLYGKLLAAGHGKPAVELKKIAS